MKNNSIIAIKSIMIICLLALLPFAVSNSLYSQNTLDIFTIDETLRTTIALEDDLQNFSVLRINDIKKSYESFRNQNATFRLKLPIDVNNIIEIELTEHNFYADNFSVIEKTATGDKLVNFERPLHYLGKVVGQNTSTVGLTLSKDQLYGVISYSGNNYNIEFKTNNSDGDYYLLYRQEDYKHPLNFKCGIDTDERELSALGSRPSANKSTNRDVSPVNIYIECDYQMFLSNGSTNATSNYAASLFNMVAGIYRASTNPTSGPRGANTILNLSQLAIWTTPDPYDATTLNSPADLLSLFRCQHEGQNYNGRLAHILTAARIGGGNADMPICPTTGTDSSPSYGVTEVTNSFNANLSIYSVDIYVLAHELGHQFSAPHTHECAWNGNNTPIDCCGNNAGYPACACSAGIPSPKGTIMSYCHLEYINNSPTGNPGIGLSQGFHPQVAAKIENFATNCLSPTVAAPLCAAPTNNEIIFSNITNTSVTINCTKTGDFYAFEYLDVATGIVTCVNCANASSSGIYTLSGLSPCKSYEVSVVVFCNGDWSRSTLFGCDDVSFMTTGADCVIDGVCRTSIIVTDSAVPGSTGVFEAATTIQTNGNIAVNSGETVSFHAGNSITLNPGFHAKRGSSFTADIQNCTPALQEEELFNKALVKANEEVSNNKLSTNQYTQLTSFSDIKLTIQPNPFTNLTTLYFNLTEKEEINLLVFNINGQLMDEIILKQSMDKGFHTVNYDAYKLEEGIFHLVLKTNKAIQIKKMIVIK